MKTASSSFLVLFFAAVLVSFNSFAQPNETLRETVNQNIRADERLRLADLLRLSNQEQSSIEILALTLNAESLIQGPAILELSQRGRPIATETVKKQLKEVRLTLPARTMVEGLELSSQSEIYIQSITAEVRYTRVPGPGPGRHPQVAAHSIIKLVVKQQVRGQAFINLEQLAKKQLGVSIEGAQIERVVVQGLPISGRAASVQVELNRRLVGPVKYLSLAQRKVPLPVQSLEKVRSLTVLVTGHAEIMEIRVRVGQVRQRQPVLPRIQRVQVNQEVSARMPLDLSRLMYDQRLVHSVTIEARGQRNARATLELIAMHGAVQGAVLVGVQQVKVTIELRRPMLLRNLRLQSMNPVAVEAVEIKFE